MAQPTHNNDLLKEEIPEEETAIPGELPTEAEQPIEELPLSKSKRIWQFVAGLLGWFLVNGMIWLLLTGGGKSSFQNEGGIICNSLLIFPANIILLVVLAWKKGTRNIAWGIVTAIGVNLVVSSILGLINNAFCLVPFFS